MTFKFLRAGAIYTAGNAISAGVPFLLLPVLTRALSPGDYGMVVSFFVLVTFTTSLAGLNVHSAVAVKWFERAKFDFARLVGTALCLATVSTLICGALLLMCAPILKSKLELPTQFWFLAALQTGGNVVLGIRTALWQSQAKAIPAASLQVCAAVLNVTLSLLAVFTLHLGGAGRIMGSVCASMVGALLAVFLLMRDRTVRFAPGGEDLRALLRFGLPLIPYAITAALLATADRL
jgi:O-antigen/teichoic acid export membrane protein